MPCTINNNTSSDLSQLEDLTQKLVPFVQKQIGFNRPPTINFNDDEKNAANPLGKTAQYDPSNMEIIVFVTGRHTKDVLRSIAHELVHHGQNCRGDLDGNIQTELGYAQNNEHMRGMEREAYEVGNLSFRDWEDGIKQQLPLYETIYRESLIGGENMSTKDWKDQELNNLLMKKWGYDVPADETLNEELDAFMDSSEGGDYQTGQKVLDDDEKTLDEDEESSDQLHQVAQSVEFRERLPKHEETFTEKKNEKIRFQEFARSMAEDPDTWEKNLPLLEDYLEKEFGKKTLQENYGFIINQTKEVAQLLSNPNNEQILNEAIGYLREDRKYCKYLKGWKKALCNVLGGMFFGPSKKLRKALKKAPRPRSHAGKLLSKAAKEGWAKRHAKYSWKLCKGGNKHVPSKKCLALLAFLGFHGVGQARIGLGLRPQDEPGYKPPIQHIEDPEIDISEEVPYVYTEDDFELEEYELGDEEVPSVSTEDDFIKTRKPRKSRSR
jgi:hypothetical protein